MGNNQNANANPNRNPNTLWKRFGTEIVTLNTETRQYHVLNATAAMIFEMSTGEHSQEDMAEIITDVFGVEKEQALSDVRETLAGMEKLGLIAVSTS